MQFRSGKHASVCYLHVNLFMTLIDGRLFIFYVGKKEIAPVFMLWSTYTSSMCGPTRNRCNIFRLVLSFMQGKNGGVPPSKKSIFSRITKKVITQVDYLFAVNCHIECFNIGHVECVRYDAATERKSKILDIIRSFDLPNNPLDDIIDQVSNE